MARVSRAALTIWISSVTGSTWDVYQLVRADFATQRCQSTMSWKLTGRFA